MLDQLEGESQVFKAKDDGNRHMLMRSSVPKTLLLKEGAPVILIKNLAGGLFNGQRGIVHKLSEGHAPIINFNGYLHEMKPEKFEVFDANQNKILASRTQIPVILAFAMTVHRAQGQTIEHLEVDCSSFFAPGQLGVAVGRAVCKSSLSIRNFNMASAFMKHPHCVYEFYRKTFKAMELDKSCCSGNLLNILTDCPTDLPGEVFTSEPEVFGGPELELPRLDCPFDINEFIQDNISSEFVKILTPDFISSEEFKRHLEYIHFKVNECIAGDTSTNTKWMRSYTSLNKFLVRNEHLNSVCYLFHVHHISKIQNKMSSKLSFWIMDKLIQVKSSAAQSKPPITLSEQPTSRSGPSTSQSETLTSQSGPSTTNVQSLTEAESKLRYIAGVCVHKIRQRLKESVKRSLGKQNKVSKPNRQINYKKEKMLKIFSVSEDKTDQNDPTMLEIEFKQNKSRGLTVVNDAVFDFFKKLHMELQALLSAENMHLILDDIHNLCRNNIDSNNNLLSCWISLFCLENDDNFDDEMLIVLLAELYQSVTEHFIRLSIVDSLKQFKSSIPRRKRQALRTKIQALGERSGAKEKTELPEKDSKKKKTKLSSSKKSKKVKDSEILLENVPVYFCPICENVCEEEPFDTEDESIGCDKCDKWFHYGCVNLTGSEAFLKQSNSNWYCKSCSKKGKGKGNSTSK